MWSCKTCHFPNEKEATSCVVCCYTRFPVALWACEACLYRYNNPTETKCAACDTEQEVAAPLAPMVKQEPPEQGEGKGTFIRKRKAEAAPTLSLMERLREELEACRIPNTAAADTVALADSLQRCGAAIVSLDPGNVDIAAMLKKVGALTAKTFPAVTLASQQALGQGDFTLFNNEWKTKLVAQHRILLRDYGMPVPVPIHTSVCHDYVDPVTQLVMRYNPLAAQSPAAVWDLLPPDLIPDGAYLTADGIKTKPGNTAIPLHYDGDHTHENKEHEPNTGRIQVVFINDDPGAQRHLFVVPNNREIQRLIAEITGTQGTMKRGFKTLNLKAFPDLYNVLMEYGQTVVGLLLFKAGTFHFERENPVFNKKAPGRTFRAYCGYILNARSIVTVEQRIRLVFLRGEGYAMDPFNKLGRNSMHALFVNDKRCQYHNVKEMAPDGVLTALFATPMSVMIRTLLEKMPAKELKMYALSTEELQKALLDAERLE